MNEAEKEKTIGELKTFYTKIRSYYNRQRKRDKGGFTEAQDRNLNALRLELQRDYGRLGATISKYGGKAHTLISSNYVDAFYVALQSLTMEIWDFEALDGAIIVVNQAIGKLESISSANSAPEDEAFITSPKAFIAHGGETKSRHKLQRFLFALGVQPLIIEEEPKEGRSPNEQVEYYLEQADCAIILGTADDKELKDGKLYPRRNVHIEIGRMQERFPKRIVYLLEEGASFPSNISEKLYTRFTQENMDEAFITIARELQAFRILKAVKPQHKETLETI